MHMHAASPILRVGDLERSLDYYTRVLGFTVDWRQPALFASVSREACNLMLSEGDQGHAGSWVYIGVGDVERLHAELSDRGARIRNPPSDYDWAREMQIEDLDGNVLRFGSEPREGQPSGDWLDMYGARWRARPEGGWSRLVPARLEPPVEVLVAELASAWEQGDGPRFARLFDSDARYITGSGECLVGRAAIAGRVAEAASNGDTAPLTLVPESVHRLACDLVLVLLRWRLAVRAGLITLVLRQVGPEWAIAWLQNTDVTFGPR